MKNAFKLILWLWACCTAHVQADTGTLQVWGSDLTLTADGSTISKLTIYEKDVVDYTAVTLSLVVPKGVKVAQVRSGREYVNDIQLNPDRATSTHAITCYQASETIINVVISSSTNQNLYPDDIEHNPVEELFTIGLTANPTMVNGEYEARIVNSKFALAGGGGSVPAEEPRMKLTVEGGVEGTVVNYALTEAGFGTLILPFEAALPEGVEAFRCIGVQDDCIVTEELNCIPANTPVLLAGAPGRFTFTGEAVPQQASFTDGLLTGVMERTEITQGYVLQQQDELSFYPVNAEKPITVPAFRCYLIYPQALRAIRIGGELTGVGGLQADKAPAQGCYDLQGKRVGKPAMKGVYIKEGKKIIVD